MINTVADSFASQVYLKDIDEVVAVMEGVAGVGMIVSPVIGIYAYQGTGFANSFYIFGAFILPTAILAFWLPTPKQHLIKLRLAGAVADGSEAAQEETQ